MDKCMFNTCFIAKRYSVQSVIRSRYQTDRTLIYSTTIQGLSYFLFWVTWFLTFGVILRYFSASSHHHPIQQHPQARLIWTSSSSGWVRSSCSLHNHRSIIFSTEFVIFICQGSVRDLCGTCISNIQLNYLPSAWAIYHCHPVVFCLYKKDQVKHLTICHNLNGELDESIVNVLLNVTQTLLYHRDSDQVRMMYWVNIESLNGLLKIHIHPN